MLVRCAPLEHLRSAADADVDVAFQGMFVTIYKASERIVTENGERLFMPVVMHDFTGSVAAALTDTAVKQFYDVDDETEAVQKAENDELKPCAFRWNVHGVRRKGELYITKLLSCSWAQKPTRAAMNLRNVIAECGPFRGGIFAAEASHIVSRGFANLAVETPSKLLLQLHRLILHARGAEKSTLEKASADPDARVVCSANVNVCPALSTRKSIYGGMQKKWIYSITSSTKMQPLSS